MSQLGEAIAAFLAEDDSDDYILNDAKSNARTQGAKSPGDQFVTPRPEGVKDKLTREDIDEEPLWKNIPNPNHLTDAYYNWVRARLPFTPEAEWNKDLVRGDRSTNVSGRDPRDVARLSRLADKMNNRVYLGPADIGHRTFNMGNDPIRFSQMYQMPKVETEDTRQMERMRQYEAQDRTRDIARQNDYKDLDRLWADRKYIETMRREGRMSDKEADYRLKPLDEEIRRLILKFDTTNLKHLKSWETTMTQLGIPVAIGNLIYKTAGENPLLAKTLAMALNKPGAPDAMQILRNSALYNLYNDKSLSEIDKIFQTNNWDNWLGIEMAKEAFKVGNDEAQQLIQLYQQSGGNIEGMLQMLGDMNANMPDMEAMD